MDRQLSFDGREVTQIKTKWGDLELDQLPDGMTRDQLAALTIGDEVVVMARYKLEDVGHNEKVDRQGTGVKPLTRQLRFKTLARDFIVEGVLTRAEQQEQWKATHTG